jgi:hypothetical protein
VAAFQQQDPIYPEGEKIILRESLRREVSTYSMFRNKTKTKKKKL